MRTMRTMTESAVGRALAIDGSMISYRWLLTSLAAVAAFVTGALVEVPITGFTVPSPVLSGPILLVAALAGAVDARAGLFAGILGVMAGFLFSAGGTSLLGGLSILGQMLVVVLLSSVVPLIARTAAWQADERIGVRLSPRVRGLVRTLGIAALTVLLVQGWLSALPVFAASVIPGAGFVETGAPSSSVWLGPAMATAVAIRVAALGLADAQSGRRSDMDGRSAFLRGVPGAAILVLLVTSLYDGARAQLVVVAVVIFLIRAVQAGIVPPPFVLLGGERHTLLLRIPPVAVFLGALSLALVLGLSAGASPDRVRAAYLALLFGLLLLSRGPGLSRPQRGTVASLAAVTVLTVTVFSVPTQAMGQSPDLSGVIGRSATITYTWFQVVDVPEEGDVLADGRATYRITVTDAVLEPGGLRLTVEGEYPSRYSAACVGEETGTEDREIVLLAVPAPLDDLDIALHPDRPYADLQNAWFPLGTVTWNWSMSIEREETASPTRVFGTCPRWYEGTRTETFSQRLDVPIPNEILLDPAFALSGILVRSFPVEITDLDFPTRFGFGFQDSEGEVLDLALLAASLTGPESPTQAAPEPASPTAMEPSRVDDVPSSHTSTQRLPPPPPGIVVPPVVGMLATSLLLLGISAAPGPTVSAAAGSGAGSADAAGSPLPEAAGPYGVQSASSEVAQALGRPAIGLPEANIERLLEGDAEGPAAPSD